MPAALDKEAARAPGRDLPPAKADQETEPKASVRKAEAKASVKEAARARAGKRSRTGPGSRITPLWQKKRCDPCRGPSDPGGIQQKMLVFL
ncbi:hypothetical protein DWY99_08755 [[Clostridium] leptum]|uniref:Uncharacterized protein n=1 Tax=[Clostridium] leptum TaxID=1535 RepID=A0A412AWI6_9FIRM|nr:hypothetical protein DWY99_08755 [[Clostridium] leptum]